MQKFIYIWIRCGKLENKIAIINLRRQFNQVVLHEQVKNGIVISNNLNTYKVDQWFKTPRKVPQTKQRHYSWTKKRLASHRMLQATPIIFHEMQTGEAQSALVVYYKIRKGKNIKLKMQTHRLNFNKGVENLNLDKELC
jgi:hypothetical protein